MSAVVPDMDRTFSARGPSHSVATYKAKSMICIDFFGTPEDAS